MTKEKVPLRIEQAHVALTNKYSNYLLPIILMVVDYCAVLCAEQIAAGLRDMFFLQKGILHVSWLNFYVIFPLTYLLFFHSCDLYTRTTQFWKIMSRIFKANIYALATIVALLYIGRITASTSRAFIVLMGIFTFFFVIVFRYFTKKIFEHFSILRTPVLIMGAGKTAALILEHIRNDSGINYEFIGYLEDNTPDADVAKQLPYLGKFADAEKVVKATGIQDIMLIAPGMDTIAMQNLVYRLQPLVKNISFIPDMGNLPLAAMDVETLIDGHIAQFKVRNNLASKYNKAVKLVFDLILTLIGTICISPVLLVIALWIYKDSPGPIIYKRWVVGKNGREFAFYKFRSMCVDSDAQLKKILATDPAAKAEYEKYYKLKDDPRITKSGAFLRKTSLDELPQIFNVLKGEMSLVGPRPITKDEVPRYGNYIEDYYMVRPGITGMWQTSGRSDVEYTERVQMDSWYVRNWNIWFDVVLLWRTFQVVFKKKGAY